MTDKERIKQWLQVRIDTLSNGIGGASHSHMYAAAKIDAFKEVSDLIDSLPEEHTILCMWEDTVLAQTMGDSDDIYYTLDGELEESKLRHLISQGKIQPGDKVNVIIIKRKEL